MKFGSYHVAYCEISGIEEWLYLSVNVRSVSALELYSS